MTNRKFTEESEHKIATYSHSADKDKDVKETQHVRARKVYHLNQVHQDSINKSSSSDNNVNNVNNVNNNPNNSILNYYYKFIIDKFIQLYQLPLNTKIGSVIIVCLLISSTLYFLSPERPPASPFFRDFAHTTKSTFEEINSIELPASDELTQHTVASRNAANMVQNSPAFKDYGPQIASGLIDFGEKVTLAARLLQNMYNKGSAVYKTFDLEIEAMMNRLKMNLKKGEAKYFKKKVHKLIDKIKDFRQMVESTQSSIVNAEETRHDTEGYIMEGVREAEKFIKSGENERDNAQLVVDVSRANKELTSVTDLLSHLGSAAVRLDKIKNLLTKYEDKLLNVEAELSSTGVDDEGIFEVTKEDLTYLKQSLDALKASHYKFDSLSN